MNLFHAFFPYLFNDISATKYYPRKLSNRQIQKLKITCSFSVISATSVNGGYIKKDILKPNMQHGFQFVNFADRDYLGYHN